MVDSLLCVEDLSVSFSRRDGGDLKVVDGVTFSVNEKETVCLVGESGSGKSVTLLGILGLLDPQRCRLRGSVKFKGREILNQPSSVMRSIRGRDIALISQDPMTALTPVRTVGSQVVEQIREHTDVSRSTARRRAVELLGEVGIVNPTAVFDRYPHQLSGGMRQRVVIAAALSCSPSLLIADEPTTALDVTVQAQILDLLRRLGRDFGSSIVLVTHDMGVVAEMADRVLIMYGGRVVERAARDEIFLDPWHPYTWGLIGSIPRLDGPRSARLVYIPGTPPQPGQWPQGCVFGPRCAVVQPACALPPPTHRVEGREVQCVLDAQTRQQKRNDLSRNSNPHLPA